MFAADALNNGDRMYFSSTFLMDLPLEEEKAF